MAPRPLPRKRCKDMTTDLNPEEYVSLFNQTGVEPPLRHLNFKEEPPSVFLSFAITEALLHHQDFVKNILNSNLAQTLKEEEKKNWWRSLLPGRKIPHLSQSHPWSWALGNGVETNLSLPKQSLRAFTDFIKENLETLKKIKLSHRQTGVDFLFSRMKDLSLANKPPQTYGHAVPFLQEIFDLCPPKIKKQCLLALASDLNENEHFDFVVKNGPPYISHKNEIFYSQILYFAIRFSSTQKQIVEALSLLKNPQLLNKVLGGVIVYLEAPSRISWDQTPNVDKLCALLPYTQQKEVLKEALRLSMRVQDLPPTLYKVWEHGHITEALQKSTHTTQSPQNPNPPSRRKM